MNITKLTPLVLVITFCLFSLQSNAQFGDLLGINITDGVGDNGSTVCIDFNVENFDSIGSMSFAVSWDASVISANEPENLGLPTIGGGNFNTTEMDKGFLSFIWLDSPTVLPDNSTLFTICFDVIGDPGSFSTIYVNGISIDIEVGKVVDGEDIFIDSINTTSGSVTVTATDLTIISGYCEASADTASDGSLRFYATGGEGPYSFIMLTPSGSSVSGNLFENQYKEYFDLEQGVYSITVTDANGSIIDNINITHSNPLTFDLLDLKNPTCAWISPNGYLEINEAQGGYELAPYTYQWSNFRFNTRRIEDLAAGDYTVTVTDNNKCSATATYTLTQDTLMLTHRIIRPESCVGSDDGQVELIATGGIPNAGGRYDLWVKSPNWRQTTTMTDGAPLSIFLEGGDEVRVQDSTGCSTTAQIIEMPHIYDVEFNTTLSSRQCFGDLFDTIRSIPFLSGAGPFDNNGGFTFSLTDESGSNYMPTGGVLGGEYINENIDTPDTLFLSVTEVQFTQGLGASCVGTDTIIFAPAPTELVLNSQIIQPTCDSITGTIEILAEGALPSYNYLWNDSITDSLRSNLIPGDYSVVVTDANGCLDSLEFTINDIPQFTINAELLQESVCEEANGSAIVYISNIDIYNIRWLLDGSVVGTGSGPECSICQIDGLVPGEYIVEVDNLSGCIKADTIVVTSLSDITIDSTFSIQPLCPDSSSLGQLEVFGAGGDGQYTYEWRKINDTTIISTSSILTGFGIGTYEVDVYDSKGCKADTSLILFNTDSIKIAVSNIVGTTCFGTTDGMALATASGGTVNSGIYNYRWENGVRGDSLMEHQNNSLSQNTNWVIAYDGVCLSDTAFFEMPIIEELTVDLEFTPPSCVDACDGSATITPTGGNGTYDVLWLDLFDNTGEVVRANSLTDLCAGIYHIAIKDFKDCQNIDSIELVDPDTLIASIDSLLFRNISCKDDLGQIGVNTVGGITPYEYAWSSNASLTSLATGLNVGEHIVTVTDANGCMDTLMASISADSKVSAVINKPDSILCFGSPTCISVASVSGGSGLGYSFQVNQGLLFPIDSCVEAYAGTYFVSVFDDAGCFYDTSFTILQPEPITADVGPDIELELGGELPEIEVILDSPGDSEISTVNWSLENGIECVNDDCSIIRLTQLTNGLLEARITDTDGCEAEDDLNLSISTKRHVYFSNIFSPNNDNVNDTWLPKLGLGTVSLDYVQIFDRWGNKVFVEENMDPNGIGWDGRYNGQLLNPGVYVFVTKVSFIDGVSKDYSGSITLVR